MRQVNKKLGSRTGASIMAALLLFLVCAILDSVVLAAATAASGRMAQMAETDQRYYAVTSAAELIKDFLTEDNCVTVVEKKQASLQTMYPGKIEQSGSLTGDGTKVYYLEKPVEEIVKSTDLIDGNLDGTTSFIKYAARRAYDSSSTDDLKLIFSSKDDEFPELKVSVTIKTDASGNLIVTAEKEGFQQILHFSSARTTGNLTPEKTTLTSPPSEGSYTVTETTTTYTTTTFRWTLTSIETKETKPTTSGGSGG